MTTKNYESVTRAPSGDDDEERARPTTTSATATSNPIAWGAAALFFLIIGISAFPRTGGKTETAAMLQLVNIKTAPPPQPCTFAECIASHCDIVEAPYLCLFHNGGPHGGCSPVPWADGTCTVSCDQGGCDALDIPSDATSCDGTPCDGIEGSCGGQTCGPDVPYQCTAGAGRHGCSGDEYHWTAYTSPETCSSCCDARTCGE